MQVSLAREGQHAEEDQLLDPATAARTALETAMMPG